MLLNSILLSALIFTGFMALTHRVLSSKKVGQVRLLAVIEFFGSLFSVFVIVFVLRSFVIEPFRIPSSSLEPTLLVGDFVAVNKYDYGLRFPVWHKTIMEVGQPQRGDIVVFRWPPNEKFNYIKRIIGIPGDKVVYHNKVLSINGVEAPQTFIETTGFADGQGKIQTVERKKEILGTVLHEIYIDPSRTAVDFSITVPQGQYFVMGDNRDHSGDSRYWGFVPDQNLVGRAFFKWMSWDADHNNIRWSRLGKAIV